MFDLLDMCECPKIHFYEVEFKLDGMIVVPTHKNCGDRLNEKQGDTFVGRGSDTDIIVASAKAYMNALNRALAANPNAG